MNATGKPISSIGFPAYHFLKMLTSNKVLPNTVINSKLQTKKADREHQRAELTSIVNGSNGFFSMILNQKFLADNILLPLNAWGNVVSVANVGV